MKRKFDKRQPCVHFRGSVDQFCGAGIDWRKLVGGPDEGCCTRWPCNPRTTDRANGPIVPCDQFRVPTPEEIEADEKAMQQAMDRMMLTLPLMAKVKAEHKGRDAKIVEVCPVCGGRLHMTHAAYNGHVWGKCETENCLSWME